MIATVFAGVSVLFVVTDAHLRSALAFESPVSLTVSRTL